MEYKRFLTVVFVLVFYHETSSESKIPTILEKLNAEILGLKQDILRIETICKNEKKESDERFDNIEKKLRLLSTTLIGGHFNGSRRKRQSTNDFYCAVRGFPGPQGPLGRQGPPGPPGPHGKPGLTIGELTDFYKNLKPPTPSGPTNSSGGATYVRWGRTTCGNASELVYSGFAAGQSSSHKGGGANYVCLHRNPQWRNYSGVAQSDAYIYGVEYEQMDRKLFSKQNAEKLNDHDVPCAVCHSGHRAAKLMIPGRRDCSTGWTKEYEGYLIAGHYGHYHNYMYECLDIAPETVLGGAINKNGGLMYVVQAYCGSLPCPPYVNYRELTCVVCTK